MRLSSWSHTQKPLIRLCSQLGTRFTVEDSGYGENFHTKPTSTQHVSIGSWTATAYKPFDYNNK
jgi:hypothetical protein